MFNAMCATEKYHIAVVKLWRMLCFKMLNLMLQWLHLVEDLSAFSRPSQSKITILMAVFQTNFVLAWFI